jgi:serine/threonine protein kinase
MLEPGRTVERWTIESVVGQGGMAVVYRVRHTALETVAALKVLSVPKQTVRDRLIREGRAQAALRHPNIVTVTDVLELDGNPALILEYVDGPSLEKWIEQHRDTALVEPIFRGICAGVAEAHAAGFVHRDLKPGNVLLARTRRGWVPKVTDFGIVKSWLVDEDGLDTKTNVAMGTPYYMAPEQIRDAKHVDPRADVFALGCILYEMIAGSKPFTGSDVLEVLNNVAAGRYQPLVPNSASERILYAVECCLKVERDERPADADAVLRILDGEQLGQRRQDPPTLPPEPVRLRTASGERRAVVHPNVHQPDATGDELLANIEERVSDEPSFEAATVPAAPPRELSRPSRQRSSMVWWVALVTPFLLLAGSAGLLWTVWPRPKTRLPVDDQSFMATQPGPEEVQGVIEPDPGALVMDNPATKRPKPQAKPAQPEEGGFLFGPAKVGSVLVDGKVDGIALVDGTGKQFLPGTVPAGHYTVELVDNGTRRKPTSINVTEGATVRLDCRDRSFGCLPVAPR